MQSNASLSARLRLLTRPCCVVLALRCGAVCRCTAGDAGLMEWAANVYYCAGRVVVPALLDTFVCQAFNKRVRLCVVVVVLWRRGGRAAAALHCTAACPLSPAGTSQPAGDKTSSSSNCLRLACRCSGCGGLLAPSSLQQGGMRACMHGSTSYSLCLDPPKGCACKVSLCLPACRPAACLEREDCVRPLAMPRPCLL